MAEFEDLPFAMQVAIDSACDQVEATLRDGALPDCDGLAHRLPPPCRDAFLRESRRLIRDYQRQGTIASTDAGDAAFLGGLFEGEHLGRFQLLKELGSGSFGVVWLAEDSSPRRRVALKVAYPKMGDRLPLERFRREADAMARLDHPGIVRIHECGRSGRLLYIACEFVDGVDLGQALAKGPRLSHDAAISIIRELALALDHAHAHQVVHRDIKPANIILDTRGRPRLTDFGLARIGDSPDGLTLAGEVMGTFDYMSPEQAAGNGSLATGATDVWSLGVILYRMLAGALPFQGRESAILASIRHDDPPPPSRFDSSIDAGLETICLKCLRKDPSDRYTAQELADDLDRWVRGDRLRARRPGWAHHARRFAMRHAVPLTMSAVGLSFVVCAGVGYFGLSSSRRAEQDRLIGAIAAGAEESRGLLERRPDLVERARGSLAGPGLLEIHRLRLLMALPAPDRSERELLRQQLTRAPAAEFPALRDRVRRLPLDVGEPGPAETVGNHWRGALLRAGERLGVPDSLAIVRGILAEPEGEFGRWVELVLPHRDPLAAAAAGELRRLDLADERRGRLVTMIASLAASPTAAGDLLLESAAPEDTPHLARLMRERSEFDLAIRRRPDSADSLDDPDAVALAILAALARHPEPAALLAAMEHPCEPTRRRIILRLARSGIELDLALRSILAASGHAGVAGTLAAIGQYPLPAIDARRPELQALAHALMLHPDPEVSANAIWLAGRVSPTPISRRELLRRIPALSPREAAAAGKAWFVDPFGIRFVRLRNKSDGGRSRTIYLADTEVTPSVYLKHGKQNPNHGVLVFKNPEEKPMHMVSGLEAVEFHQRVTAALNVPNVSYRLPKAEEWDEGFRAGREQTLDLEICFGFVDSVTPPEIESGAFPASRIGLHDMVGMVQEIADPAGSVRFPVLGTSYRFHPLRNTENGKEIEGAFGRYFIGFRSVVEVSR